MPADGKWDLTRHLKGQISYNGRHLQHEMRLRIQLISVFSFVLRYHENPNSHMQVFVKSSSCLMVRSHAPVCKE